MHRSRRGTARHRVDEPQVRELDGPPQVPGDRPLLRGGENGTARPSSSTRSPTSVAASVEAVVESRCTA